MELSLQFEDNNSYHHDIILRFAGQSWVCDSYWLALDPELLPGDDSRDKIIAVLLRLLEQWLSAVENVSDGGVVFLPYDFSDQYTGWLRCFRYDETVSVCRGWAKIEAMAISPSAVGQYLECLPEFRPLGPTINVPEGELIEALRQMVVQNT